MRCGSSAGCVPAVAWSCRRSLPPMCVSLLATCGVTPLRRATKSLGVVGLVGRNRLRAPTWHGVEHRQRRGSLPESIGVCTTAPTTSPGGFPSEHAHEARMAAVLLLFLKSPRIGISRPRGFRCCAAALPVSLRVACAGPPLPSSSLPSLATKLLRLAHAWINVPSTREVFLAQQAALSARPRPRRRSSRSPRVRAGGRDLGEARVVPRPHRRWPGQ